MNAVIPSHVFKQNENNSFLNLLKQENHAFKETLLTKQMANDFESTMLLENLDKTFADLPLNILKQLYETLMNHEQLSEELEHEIIEHIGIKQIVLDEQIDEQHPHFERIVHELAELIYVKKELEKNYSLLTHQSQTPLQMLAHELDQLNHQVIHSKKIMENEVHQLLGQARLLLEGISSEQEITKIAPKILDLLDKWTVLENELTHNYHKGNTHKLLGEEKVDFLWKELLNTYQKRMGLYTKQRYHTEAKVTNRDVVKWIRNALARESQQVINQQAQQVNIANIPVSNIENYMIHIHQISSKPVDVQFVEQFQQVLNTSHFLSNNGVNQLAITLQPENLGEMLVRFTEINGEITVKILVSSQTARQMLEANIQELRNIFSPHQISIEEQEIDLQQIHQQLEDEFLEEQSQDQSQHHDEEKESSDNNFEEEFHEYLLNEKA